MENLKIDAISDTHTLHERFVMPGGDILIHSGDATSLGELRESVKFLNWLADQNYKHIIFVPGNHDKIFESNEPLMRAECEARGIHLLIDQTIEVEGLKIHGSPVQPWFHDWAFNRHRGQAIKKHWDMIPVDTDILITHGPARGILDYVPRENGVLEHVGCADLLAKIYETKVKLHVFGHIHYAAGHKYIDGRTYVNASALNEQYGPTNGNPKRIVIEDGNFLVESES